MKLKINESINETGKALYEFDGEITVNEINELKSKMVKSVKKFSELEFDFSMVKKIDSSGFQLFIYLKREAEKVHKSVKINNYSNVTKMLFCLFGEQYSTGVIT